ncbi:C2H2-type zinc finger protein [Chloroflexota bacterium]
MIKCTKCGREFKSPQALGGHMRGGHQEETQQETQQDSNHPNNPEDPNNTVETIEAPGGETVLVSQDTGSNNHPGNPEDIAEPIETIEEPVKETALMPEEVSKAEQIRTYLKQGFTIKQLTDRFDFSETTIRQEIAKVVRPEGEAIDDKTKQQDNAWPVVRKMGGGMEIMSPEAVLRQYMGGGTPEEQLELRAIMKFRAAMLMVMDLVNVQKGSAEADAKRMEPILRLMKETREEQDAAAQRAKASSEEIADRAAYETAGQLSQVISQNNTRITDSINQIRQAMGGKEENPLGQVLNSIQSLQQMMGMFGISMPGMPGAQGGGPPADQWQPPSITHRKRNETEGGV